jgi:hypothetical protein
MLVHDRLFSAPKYFGSTCALIGDRHFPSQAHINFRHSSQLSGHSTITGNRFQRGKKTAASDKACSGNEYRQVTRLAIACRETQPLGNMRICSLSRKSAKGSKSALQCANRDQTKSLVSVTNSLTCNRLS